jgi:general secretion pathway protein A
MYLAYWQLERRPFENTADTRFYYPSETQQSVLLKLRYAVESRQGAALLAGAPGLGKTLLMQTLLSQLPEACQPRARLVFPQLPADQLLATLADELTGESYPGLPPMRDSLRRLTGVLGENTAAGRHAILVIDEAHLLADAGTLSTLRLLLNLECDGQLPFTLLLVGQASLMTTLDRIPDFEQRLATRCLLQRFTAEETAAYVEHRLRTAGARHTIFDASALDALHRHAQGIPRKINRLCDLALVVGFAEELRILRSEQIEAISEELLSAAVS